MIRCVKCGRDNADGMRFCTNCGAVLETESTGETTAVGSSAPETLSFPAPTPTSSSEGWPTIGAFTPPPPVQPASKGKSNTGLIAGVVGVLLLLVLGGAGVVGWYLYSKSDTEVSNLNRKTGNENASPSPSANANTRPSPEVKPSPAFRSFEPPTAPTKEGSFTVYANEGWQLSNIAVVPYEKYTTKVDGIVDLAGAKAGIRAGGDKDAKLKSRRLFAEWPTGALLMRTRYADGRFSNTVAVVAGASGSWENLPDERGMLEFTINDNAPQDNGGQFTVRVKMTSVPKSK